MFNNDDMGGFDNVLLGRTILFGFIIMTSGAVNEAVNING